MGVKVEDQAVLRTFSSPSRRILHHLVVRQAHAHRSRSRERIGVRRGRAGRPAGRDCRRRPSAWCVSVEPAAVALGGPACPGRVAPRPPLLALALPAFDALGKLLVEGSRLARGAAPLRRREHVDLPAAVAPPDVEPVARPHRLRRLRALAVDAHLAAGHRGGRGAPGLEEARRPKPAVDPEGGRSGRGSRSGRVGFAGGVGQGGAGLGTGPFHAAEWVRTGEPGSVESERRRTWERGSWERGRLARIFFRALRPRCGRDTSVPRKSGGHRCLAPSRSA